MSQDINRVVLKGRVVRKPIVRYMPSGAAVCTFTLVTRFGTHDEFHKLVGYYEAAEQAAREFDTGDTIWFEGYIRTREFLNDEDKKAGRTKKRSVLEIVAETWELVRKSKRSQDNQDPPETDAEAINPGAESVPTRDADGDETPKPLSYL
jgi:single stranded DNA-binding protein